MPSENLFRKNVCVALLVAGIQIRSLSALRSISFNHARNGLISHHAKTDHFSSRIESSLWDAGNSAGDEVAFASSFLYQDTFEGLDDSLLAYLPDSGKYIPPRMRRLIKRITSEYVHGVDKQPKIDLADILEVVDIEHEALSPAVSFTVDNQTFDDPRIVTIVSLAVLHQLPKEIALTLLDADNETQAMADFRPVFEDRGWERVSFPKGLGIRIKEKIQYNPNQPFFPPSKLPWRSRSKRKAAEAATRGIAKAAETQAPQRNMMTKEEFLAEIESEIQAAPFPGLPANETTASIRDTLTLDGALPSFPVERYSIAWTKTKRQLMNPPKFLSRNKSLKTILTVAETQVNKLKQAGRAGILSYAFINFALYTIGIVWQWRRIVVEMPIPDGATLVSLIIRKFMKAFQRVYVGAAVFKLFRIVAALALAPAAGRVLQFTQRKLRVSENTALVILVTLLLKTFIGTLLITCLGDTALRQAIPVAPPLAIAMLTSVSV